MCLFPLPNSNLNSLAYKKGIKEFDCGACPECLNKRSSLWALRSVYECKSHAYNCMVTLTYDTFQRDSYGNLTNKENPVNPNIIVNKRDIQLFIKRLRKWYSSISSERIKYLCCAEYGSHTHRAHYHLILFGVNFPDIHFYKKSKRGNVIYMSNILTKLWNHGICTVDSINVHSGIARYCTKYCAKSRSSETFTLCSQFIGLDNLLKDFNGLSYFVDGREYPIPRIVWQAYIMNKYCYMSNIMSYKYVNRNKDIEFTADDSEFLKSVFMRKMYRFQRDKDPVYSKYLDYWRSKGSLFESLKPDILTRINSLPESKFHFYKLAALKCYALRKQFIPAVAPGSNCVSAYEHYLEEKRCKSYDLQFFKRSLAFSPSRPNRASDTNIPSWVRFYEKFPSRLLTLSYHQCNIFDKE